MKTKFEDNHYLKKELYMLMQSDISYFEFIQDGSLDGIWYWDLKKSETVWMSPKFWEILGYEPSQMKHLTSEWQDIIFPDDLKLATDNFHKHLENPKNPYDQIVRYKHKDGSTVWVRCRGIAIRDDKGNPVRMLGAHNDITAIMNLQKELTERDNLRLLNQKLLKKRRKDDNDEVRVYDHIYYNKKSKTLKHKDLVVKLTDQEISLFELFMKNKNTILSLGEIEYFLNPNKFLTDNAVSLIISRMRKKLPMINIKTVYAQGYMLLAD